MAEIIGSVPFTGRLLNAAVTSVVAFSSFSLGWTILKVAIFSRTNRLFAYFWITTGFLWTASTFRNAMAAYEFSHWDVFFFYGTQILLFVSGIFLVPYLIGRITDNADAVRRAQIIYVLVALVGIFMVIVSGVNSREPTFYSTKYFVNFPGNIFVLAAMIPAIVISARELVRNFSGYMHGVELAYPLLSVLSIVVYLVGGIIDESGIIGGWSLIVFRIIYIGAFMLAYAAVVSEREAKKGGAENEFIV